MQIQSTNDEVRQQRVFQESLRLIHLERNGGDLVDQGLDGRQKTAENVSKLWRAVRNAYSASFGLGRGNGHNGALRYWEEISAFLETEGWEQEQLTALYSGPGRAAGEPSLFDGLED
jgi:hypothetical protein